jgi:Alpha/beta-hydrolase family
MTIRNLGDFTSAIGDVPAGKRVYLDGPNGAFTIDGNPEDIHVACLSCWTPTGTGWVDPAAMDSVEYLHDGAVASVALQYSYLASWLYLLVEPGYGADVARALQGDLRILDHASQGQPAETLSARS